MLLLKSVVAVVKGIEVFHGVVIVLMCSCDFDEKTDEETINFTDTLIV